MTRRPRSRASPEQVMYADMLFWGSWLAIGLMAITFGLYVSGLVGSHIPLEDVSKYWSKSVHECVEGGHIPCGWGWVSLLGKGDYLNFVGMALLAAMTAICFPIALLPAYLRRRDWVYAGIVVLEVVVLVVAASGILGGGGH